MILVKKDLAMQLRNNKKMVAVYMITYNHENYIEKAVRTVMMQNTDFSYKLYIGDDCSSDKTSEICQKLKNEFPDKIHLVINEKNLGATKNAGIIYNLCFNNGAKYVAMLEGDDYWTDPLKLQKQVDFLEANEDFAICFHNVEEVDLEGNVLEKRLVQSSEVEKTFTIEDLAKNNIIHTVTVVFRNNVNALPEFLRYSPMGDYPLHMINATFGKIKYFPEKMAAYRVGAGLWSSQTINNQILNTIVGLKLMITYFSSNKEVVTNLENQIKILANSLVNKHTVADPEKTAYNLPFKKLIIILLKKFRHLF